MNVKKKPAYNDSGGSIEDRYINKAGLFHYNICGLDNIYLKGGFTISENKTSYSIDEVEELHDCIAMSLIKGTHDLNGKELKFLRKELSLTQSQVAKLMGSDVQAVARWEKGTKNSIADRLIRTLYLSIKHSNDNVGMIHSFLSDISDLDIKEHRDWLFEQNSQWYKCAA